MTKRLLALPAALLAVAAVAGCGGSSSPAAKTSPTPTSASPTGTAPADPAAAKAEITANWEKFFDASTPRAQSVALLEDGAQLGQALKVAEQERVASKINQKAKVKAVVFTSPTGANITFALLNGTTPVLPSASGRAVFVDGTWKVSKVTFCTLVQLGAGGKPVPGC